VHSHGDASGNARQQFDALGATTFQGDFHYDAEVVTKFPQAFSAGVSWQAHKRFRLNLQGNWIDWSNSFDLLPVFLTNGSNQDLNGFVGSDALNDVIRCRGKTRACSNWALNRRWVNTSPSEVVIRTQPMRCLHPR